MKKTIPHIFFGSILLFALFSCEKSQEGIEVDHSGDPLFIKYTIRAGQQYCDQSAFKQIDYTELKFIVKFDSTAIYQTLSSSNQLDINKLYGFSDNNSDHHLFSARIGWRWSNGALRLFGYIYNNAVVSYEEIGAVSIGAEHTCSIKVTSTGYIFTVNNETRTLPRASTTITATGYKLYPYFGGDESAPHDISIWIKEL